MTNTIFNIDKKTLEELNRQLSNAFLLYIKDVIRANKIALQQTSSATRKIQKQSHNPLHNTGDLFNHMEFVDGEIRFSKAMVPGSKITYEQLAIIMTNGARIPLTGAKGEKVRNWLHYHNIHISKGKMFIIIPPRPFMGKVLTGFLNSEEYSRAIDTALWR